VTRFLTESGYCPRCKKRVRSRHPERVSTATGAAGVCLGPRAVALAADLKHRLGIPYRKICGLFETAFGLQLTPGGLCQAAARLARRLRKQRKNLFTFLEREGVEATNNRAELALWPAVIVRKTGGCNRTPRGARTHAVLASLLTTAKQQGRAPVEYLVEVKLAREGQALLPFERSPPVAQPA